MTAKKTGDRPSSDVRIRVLARDKYKCVYCGVSGNNAELQVDHVVPIAKGGSNHIANLVTSCRNCNQSKGKKSVAEFNKTQSIYIDNGLFLHSFHDDGSLKYQGKVIGEDNGNYIVQLFSAADGSPTNVEFWDKQSTQEKCRFYANERAWAYAAIDFLADNPKEAKENKDFWEFAKEKL